MNLQSQIEIQAATIKPGDETGVLKVGDEVVVDGEQGRGVIERKNGRRVIVRFRSGLYLSRDQMYVHVVKADYRSPYYSGR
jgi:hypothetical protein